MPKTPSTPHCDAYHWKNISTDSTYRLPMAYCAVLLCLCRLPLCSAETSDIQTSSCNAVIVLYSLAPVQPASILSTWFSTVKTLIMFRLQVRGKLKETSSLEEMEGCAVVCVGLSAVQPRALKWKRAARTPVQAWAWAQACTLLSPLGVLQVERGNAVLHPIFPHWFQLLCYKCLLKSP